jgi:hypothetical protein
MAQRVPEINGASIVLTGSFNPAIFQPQWFVRQNLLPEAEAETAKNLVLLAQQAAQVCDFETERFRIQVTTDRFMVMSKAAANPIPIRDLLLGTFFILEHTPATAVGLNRHMHFHLDTVEDWHQLGDRLAPKDGWKGILRGGRPGMRSLLIQSSLDGSENPAAPQLFVKVEPSTQVKQGAYFETNESYSFTKDTPLKTIMDLVRERWEEAYNHATEIADYILDWARK